MFDKIPSLKDFIIYVIPGIIICYFLLDIYNIMHTRDLFNEKVLNSASFSFIGVIFSFLIGFLLSQLQIILFCKIFKEEFESMCSIDGSFAGNDEVKKVLIERIKNVFELEDVSENDSLIVFLCLNYVKSKSNENSHIFIDRHNNMSSFAITTILPLTIVIWDVLLRFQIGIFWIVSLLVLFVIFLYILIKRIVINFKSDYYRNIFRLFLVLSPQKYSLSDPNGPFVSIEIRKSSRD